MRQRRSFGRSFQRAASLATVVAAILLSLGFYALQVAAQEGAEILPVSVFVGLAAVVGSAVNQPFRHEEGNPEQTDTGLYFLWKCSVAIAFALLLYLIFMAGMLRGGLFPEFRRTEEMFVSIQRFVLDIDPKSNADFAKLLVWSFVAGFSEKFVPNIITKLQGSGDRDDSDAGPPS
ncbi:MULTISPECIES: hypothetical protein [Aphanothece]|uniref:hypothetical protein n=1 Tax=Aphanothece TaxID=1121 RepID=UPI003984B40B